MIIYTYPLFSRVLTDIQPTLNVAAGNLISGVIYKIAHTPLPKILICGDYQGGNPALPPSPPIRGKEKPAGVSKELEAEAEYYMEKKKNLGATTEL